MAQYAYLQMIGMTPQTGSLTTLPTVRDSQRRPTFYPPKNVPCTIVSKGGSFGIFREYTQPVFGVERGTGTLGTATVAFPFTNLDIGAGAGAVSNWASTDKGTGIDVAAAGVSRWYYVGGVTEGVVQNVDITVQPIGRVMELLADWTPNRETTIALNASKRIVTLTVPNLSSSLPTIPGVTTNFLTVWARTERQAGDEWGMTNPLYYLGTVAATGGTVVDSYSIAELKARGGWYPSSFLNLYSSRAACVSGLSYATVGGAESFEGMADFSSDALGSLPNFGSTPTIPRVASVGGTSTTQLQLLQGLSGTVKPNDSRVCKILNIESAAAGAECLITVEGFHPFTSIGQRVAGEDVGGTTNVNNLTTMAISAIVSTISFRVNVAFNAPYTGGGYIAGRYLVAPEVASAADSPLTWPAWVVGKRIAITGAARAGFRIRKRVADSSGNFTIIELDKPMTAAITTGANNSTFRVSGDSNYRRSHSDPRFCDKFPVGYQLDLEGPLGSPTPTAVIAAADGGGDWCFSQNRGVKVVNIPTQISITGVPGGTPSTALRTDPLTLMVGACAPGVVFYGPNKCILGMDRKLNAWKLEGSSVTLLDPDSNMDTTLNSFADFDWRGGAVISGVTGTNGLSPTTIEVSDIASGHGMVDGQQVNLIGLTGGVDEDALTANGVFTVTVVSKTKFSVAAVFDSALTYNAGSGSFLLLAPGGNEPFDMAWGEYDERSDTAYWFFPGVQIGLSYDFRSGVLDRCEFASQLPNCGCIEEQFAPLMYDVNSDVTVQDSGASVGPNVIIAFAGNNPRAPAVWAELNYKFFNDLSGNSGDASGSYGVVISADESTVVTAGSFSEGNYGNTAVIMGHVGSDSTIGARVGSTKIITDASAGTLDFDSNYLWTRGAPEVDDVIGIGSMLMLFETGDFRAEVPVKITGIQNPQFVSTAATAEVWQLFSVSTAGGTGWTVSDSFASSTTTSSTVLALGKINVVLRRGRTSRSVRLRLAWYAPTTGKSQLDSFTVAWVDDKPRTTTIARFDPPSERGDLAEAYSTFGMNLQRGPQRNSIVQRPGSRMLTLGSDGQGTPIIGGGSGVVPTVLLDAVHLVLRVAGQPMISVTSDPWIWGFLNGTTGISPYLSLGGINTASPPDLY